MKNFYFIIIFIIVIALIFLLIFYYFSGNSGSSDNWKTGTCPSIKQIDCMPLVPPELEVYCIPENRRWIEQNCLDIKFFD